jgi:hypothetical protein
MGRSSFGTPEPNGSTGFQGPKRIAGNSKISLLTKTMVSGRRGSSIVATLDAQGDRNSSKTR